MHFHKKNFIIFLQDLIITMLGSFIIAAGISLFLLPNMISTGGISGISTVLYYLFNLPVSITVLLINLPLFIFGMFKIGKYFLLKSILGTVFLSIFIELLEYFPPITNDSFLACIYGGLLVGLGTAVLLKVHSSTGGTELVSYLVNHYKPSIKFSDIIIGVDIVVVVLNMLFLGDIEIGLYSAISIYLLGKVIDVVFEGIHFTKLLLIVSDRSQEISIAISNNVDRGVTGLYGKGMYTKNDKLVLMCAANRNDISSIKFTTKSIDPNAFIIVTNSREVLGLGFK